MYKISRSYSPDFDFEYNESSDYGNPLFTSGGVWFAFRFGAMGKMEPNHVPHVRTMMNPYRFDVTINAELQSSQRVFIECIKLNGNHFNEILSRYHDLTLKTYLKFEHQPRFYNWILVDYINTRHIDTMWIIENYRKNRKSFKKERDFWVDYIIRNNKYLKAG